MVGFSCAAHPTTKAVNRRLDTLRGTLDPSIYNAHRSPLAVREHQLLVSALSSCLLYLTSVR